jgi:iron complex transport system substrate-binding protein
MPYNWYAQNFGAIFANAWYVGKKLYPEKFSDIDPAKKADRIFSFLVGDRVFDRINAMFGNRVFEQVMEQKGD